MGEADSVTCTVSVESRAYRARIHGMNTRLERIYEMAVKILRRGSLIYTLRLLLTLLSESRALSISKVVQPSHHCIYSQTATGHGTRKPGKLKTSSLPPFGWGSGQQDGKGS